MVAGSEQVKSKYSFWDVRSISLYFYFTYTIPMTPVILQTEPSFCQLQVLANSHVIVWALETLMTGILSASAPKSEFRGSSGSVQSNSKTLTWKLNIFTIVKYNTEPKQNDPSASFCSIKMFPLNLAVTTHGLQLARRPIQNRLEMPKEWISLCYMLIIVCSVITESFGLEKTLKTT